MSQFFSTIMSGLQAMGVAIIKLLPPSPFLKFMAMMESQEWFKYFNWIVPVGTFVSILESWLVCIAVFYMYQLILRWARMIQ